MRVGCLTVWDHHVRKSLISAAIFENITINTCVDWIRSIFFFSSFWVWITTYSSKIIWLLASSAFSSTIVLYRYIYTQQQGPAIENLFFAKHFLFLIEANDKITDKRFNMINKNFHSIINIWTTCSWKNKENVYQYRTSKGKNPIRTVGVLINMISPNCCYFCFQHLVWPPLAPSLPCLDFENFSLNFSSYPGESLTIPQQQQSQVSGEC